MVVISRREAREECLSHTKLINKPTLQRSVYAWLTMEGKPRTLVLHDGVSGVWVVGRNGARMFVPEDRIKSWDDAGKVLTAI